MRALHIFTAFASDDASAISPWATRLLAALRDQGVDARVLTAAHRGAPDNTVHGIPVWRWRYSPAAWETLTHDTAIYERLRQSPLRVAQVPLLLHGGLRQARRIRRAWPPDVVHVHWPVPLAWLARPLRDVPWVFHYHQTELALLEKHPLLRPVFLPLLRRAKLHLCNSSFTLRRLRALAPDLPARVLPMPLGWTVPDGLPPREPRRVLFVGRMVYWKGGDLLLEAAAKLRRAGMELRLIMAGDGLERGAWEQRARALGVTADFPGWLTQDRLMAEYARAAVYVMPSRSDPKVWTESLGVALLEAMACGAPVIASRAGGPLDLVREGRNGWLFAPNDADDLAARLRDALADPARAEALGRQGRQDAAAFQPARVAADLREIYESLLADREPRA